MYNDDHVSANRKPCPFRGCRTSPGGLLHPIRMLRRCRSINRSELLEDVDNQPVNKGDRNSQVRSNGGDAISVRDDLEFDGRLVVFPDIALSNTVR